jgi:hypothetical protein
MRNRTLLALTVPLAALALVAPAHASSETGAFGIESVGVQALEEGGAPAVQAGSHPYSVSFSLSLATHPAPAGSAGSGRYPDGDVKNLEATLPSGLIVNLQSVGRCTEEQLALEECPLASQVGVLTGESGNNSANAILTGGTTPIYNVTPTSPSVPGELGIQISGTGIILHLIGGVRAGGDGAISAEVLGMSQFDKLDRATVTLWGDPSAASHDAQRVQCTHFTDCHNGFGVPRTGRPFLTLPTSCPGEGPPSAAGESLYSVRAESWEEPDLWTPMVSSPLPAMTGCGQLDFTPSIEVQPPASEPAVADTPTGLSADLRFPQSEVVGSPAQSTMREGVATLPAGLVVSPSTLNGLGACSEAQIGLASPAAPSCPDSSKIGSIEVVTPLLEHPLKGWVYLAQQGNGGTGQGSNPFGSLIALYLVVEGPGVLVKVPGEVQLNQSTGQLTVRFGRDPVTGFSLPQLPYSQLKLNIFGGPRAALVPSVCGSYTTTTTLTPYSAPASGPPASPQSGFAVGTGCGGGFAPSFSAGTTSNQAGAYSPFVVTFARQDSEQELGAIQVKTPPGLLGSISHVPLCPEPQAAQGTCGAESEIGEVSSAVGAGPDPFDVTGGHAYLTGPYRGAPFGLSIVVPAEGGPFKLAGTNGLGDVVVRAAISIDPRTSALTITSEPMPRMLEGVPLQVKSVTVDVNRSDFMFNPTSCEPATISATVQSARGATANASAPFQASGCASLKFTPQFSVSTSGKTSRTGGTSLDVKLSYPDAPQGSEANVHSVKVELPKQLPARLTTLRKACVAAIFEANPASCPAASVVGVARATTPLLPVALSGPAYFVSYGGAKFPELIIVLQGDGVRVDLHGETFISKARITSSTFNALPDVPVSTFELYLPEGQYSALTANGNLCTSKSLAMPTSFVAQNGAQLKQSTQIAVSGCPKAKKATSASKASKARRSSHRRGRRS